MDLRGWYDGSKLTFVADKQKVWARVNGASTIDDTLDRLADHLAMPMPMADFLYSSPYESLIGTKSSGGYVGRETIDGVPCLHVAYTHPAGRLGSLGRRTGRSAAEEVPRHQQDLHTPEDDGGHVRQVDIWCRSTRCDVRRSRAAGLRARSGRSGEAPGDGIGSVRIGTRGKLAE
jgi:hypothetical protein